MNKLIIPASPSWYETSILACAPDNTLIYGTRNSLVVVHPKPADQPADIKIIPFAHSEKITAVVLNHGWGNPSKLAVTIAEDNTVKLWDCNTYESIASHSAHSTGTEKLVGATFAGNDRVISVSEDGLIVLWRVPSNELTPIKHLLGIKAKVTCISSCPHASWLTAFGLKSGLVILADMRKNGKVLYKLRGHDKTVISLTWCPAPINVFPEKKPIHMLAKTPVKSKACDALKDIDSTALLVQETNINTVSVDEEVKDNTDAIVKEESLGQTDASKPPVRNNRKPKKENPWINLQHADDDLKILDESKSDAKADPREIDFLAECKALQDKIADTKSEEKQEAGSVETPKPDKDERRILKPKQKSANQKSMVSNLFKEAEEIQAEKIDEDFYTKPLPIKEMMLDHNGSTVAMQNLAKHFDVMYIKATTHDLESCEVKEADIKELETPIMEVSIKEDISEPKNDMDVMETDNSKERPIKEDLSTKQEMDESKIDNALIPEACKPRKEYLLASASKGGSIFIWRAGSDGRMQIELHLPGKPRNQGRKWNDKSRNEKTWIALCWITPDVLLSSSTRGELLKWNLNVPHPTSKLIHNDHASTLFCIAAPISVSNAVESSDNWRERNQKSPAAWTVGQDRMLLYTSIDNERKTLACYPTMGGSVMCFVNSPVDPNRIAIGVGDGSARVWDLSRPHLQYINMTQIWQKMSSKVLTLAWHPTDEHMLAFGTMEGRVGLINTSNLSKTPTLLSQYFRTPVHVIEWGPLNGDVLAPALYVCCEGKLAIYNTEKLLDPPTTMSTRQEYITQIAWKQDYSLLALGTKSGCIDFYSKDLQLVKVLYWQTKAIESMSWHPQATAEDSEVSPYENWIASTSSTDHTIVVFDMGNIERESTDDLSERIICELKGHTKPINNMSWSTYEGGKLVSFSDDGAAQVWNVVDKTNVATYLNGNLEGISSGIWSPLHKDLIITGCWESGIKVFDITENPPKTEDEIKEERKKRKCFVAKKKKVEKIDDDTNVVEDKKFAKDILMNLIAKHQLETKDLIHDCRRLLAFKESEDAAQIEMSDVNDSIVQKTDLEEENAKSNDGVIHLDSDANILDLFGSKDDMYRLLNKQIGQHKFRNRPIGVQHLSLWKGDIGEVIKEAIADGQISPWLISLAPMVSHKLWLDACEAYAKKLSENPKSCPIETASYYLTSHNVLQAIEVYCAAGFYREALAVAKIRLSEDAALINNITQRWATHCLVTGRFEMAAQCFIMLGQYEEAAKVLYKRTDVACLTLAVELASKGSNKELHDAVALRLQQFQTHEETALPTKMGAILNNEINKAEENKENVVNM